ncbi:hypothetical protein GCM10027402_34350 [Arthrobacter monumenti]
MKFRPINLETEHSVDEKVEPADSAHAHLRLDVQACLPEPIPGDSFNDRFRLWIDLIADPFQPYIASARQAFP